MPGIPAMGAATAHAVQGRPAGSPGSASTRRWPRPLRWPQAPPSPQAAAARTSRSALAPRAVVAVPATMRGYNVWPSPAASGRGH